jgi:hypothetical protein
MSLDIYFTEVRESEVHFQNITHNLNMMAKEAGMYKPLWRPEEVGITKAAELTPYLEKGIADMKDNPSKYRKFDAKNGWGTYDDFLPWLEELLQASKDFPESDIHISR